jgi:hypothetical protein
MAYKDPERKKAANKAWYEANKARKAATGKAWKEANREKCRVSYRHWYAANPDKARAAMNRWREANPEKAREATDRWQRENPDKLRANSALRKARKLAACPAWVDRAVLTAIFEGCPEGFHVDHIHPLKGKDVCGLHIPINLQYLPDDENMSKGNKAPPPGYFDWWSEQWCIHAEPTGRVWTPPNPEDD